MCRKCKERGKRHEKCKDLYHIIINGNNFVPVDSNCEVVIFELKHCNFDKDIAKHFHNITKRYVNASIVSKCGTHVIPVGILFSVTFSTDSLFLYVNKALLEASDNVWACTDDHQIDGNVDFFVTK
jgi:hypothetical protein